MKMASEDVIELGSSDDEAEPATKKIKPRPNAMVHIPNKIHGVTITPKDIAGKNITVTKVANKNVVSNPYAAVTKINGKLLKRPTTSFHNIRPPKQVIHVKPSVNPVIQTRPLINPVIQKRPLNNPVIHYNTCVNPLNIMKKINPQVVINKVATGNRILKPPIKIHSPKTLNSLPPSITVTRTSGSMKRTGSSMNANSLHKKPKIHQVVKPVVSDMLTVELDDDDMSSAATGSPQWYVRPEDQNTLSAEAINNKEPENPQYVHITIEDSPVKPPNKKMCEIGAELSVTIDDSPVKTATSKNADFGSDTENKPISTDKHSKKKLEYPKENKCLENSIEIEISPCIENIINTESDTMKNDVIIEIEESPLKVQSEVTSTPKKDHIRPNLSAMIPVLDLKEEDELCEFHPVYQSFIKLCFQLENSDDMKKIVEKKIKSYYRQVPKNYTESEEFIDMVSSKIVAMKAGPEKMYLYIKDIVDELNLQRKMAKSQLISNIASKTSEPEKFLYSEESEYDSKRQRQIRKLEKTLKKLHRAIQKLEEQEVDFDDDEDSVYLLTESDDGCNSVKDSDIQLVKDPKTLLLRYKERMVRVHAKFCQLTNSKMPSEPRVHIDARAGQPQGPAKKLETWINKKVPIGTPLPFPDFHDVLRCVREANEEDKLGWNEADIMEEARDLFTRCGKKLQRRRQENEWRLAASRITVDVDPAEKSEDLKKRLEENKKIAAKRETEVLNKYADRQSQLKLEAEEIGDKEAEESPVESDDDDNVDESSLQNKDKRKERLKRLLQEKSKKVPEDLADESANVPTDNICLETEKDDEKGQNLIDISTDNKVEESGLKSCKENVQTGALDDKSEANKENQLIPKDLNVEDNKLDAKNLNSDSDSIDKAVDSEVVNDKVNSDNTEKIHSLSDDSNKLESDVDELHLLQKLHSENEMNSSTSDVSGCDTPIAISDTLESSEGNEKQPSGVISIENSSYSESEVHKDAVDENDDKQENLSEKVAESLVFTDEEIERSASANEKKIAKTNNDEYNESIEDILLASTDDETEVDNNPVMAVSEEVCVKDDIVSTNETVVEVVTECVVTNKSQKQEDASSVESVTLVSPNASEKQEDTNSIESVTLVSTNPLEKEEECVNLKDDTISIGETVVEGVKDCTEIESPQRQEDTSLILSIPSEPSAKLGNDKTGNAIESTLIQKQDEFPSIESTDVSLNKNEISVDPFKETFDNNELSENIAMEITDHTDVPGNSKINDTEKEQRVELTKIIEPLSPRSAIDSNRKVVDEKASCQTQD